jgi:hypothetical protein
MMPSANGDAMSGHTVAEIAALLGVPRTTVYGYLNRPQTTEAASTLYMVQRQSGSCIKSSEIIGSTESGSTLLIQHQL